VVRPGGGFVIDGVTFPLPHRWSRKDAEQVYFCDEILRTGSVTWYWPGARVNVAASSVAGLLAQGPLPRLSMSGTSPVGARKSVTLRSLRVLPDEAAETIAPHHPSPAAGPSGGACPNERCGRCEL
jgi:hypothetical protein